MKLLDILNSNKLISENTDKNTTHNYIQGYYETAFALYENKEIAVLEIGVQKGGSIALWSEFFKNGIVYGVDVENSIQCNLNSDKIKLLFENAYTEELVNKLPNFDIMIDDGPHSLESMKFFIQHFSKKLNKDGLMIIEDVQDDSWFYELAKCVPTNFEFATIDLRPTKGRYDDLMFIMRHKPS